MSISPPITKRAKVASNGSIGSQQCDHCGRMEPLTDTRKLDNDSATARLMSNVNVEKFTPMLPPELLLEDLPMTESAARTILEGRAAIANSLNGKDDRLVLIVGPCSIHDPAAAMDYAGRLKTMSEKYDKDIITVMRVYFEKPRTTVGWKGLINDPDLDNTFKINKGLRLARQILLQVNELGLPAANEFLDTISPQFIADCVSWGAIGARTTECQLHRELASGLSMTIGFKNGTTGDCQIALDAVGAARHKHSFLGVGSQGVAVCVHTKGNPNAHVLLRGAKDFTNYDAGHVKPILDLLAKHKECPQMLMVDCSHGNSQKKHENQIKVWRDICDQMIHNREGTGDGIFGLMVESNIVEGNQALVQPSSAMVYGKSVTDACISWETTEMMFAELSDAVQKRRARRAGQA